MSETGLSSEEVDSRSQAGVHAWEGWAPLWHGGFYVALAIITVVVLFRAAPSGTRPAVTLALVGGMAGWYGLWAVARGVERQPPSRVALFFVGMAALWTALIIIDPLFQVMAAFLFVPLCIISVGWAVAAGALFVGGVAMRAFAFGGGISWLEVALVALPVGFGLLLVRYVAAIVKQSRERHRLIEELEDTRAELAAAERQAGALGERERLSREIHDALAQGFTSIVMLLEAAEESLIPDESAARRRIAQALQTARESLGEARRLVRALAPEPLVRESLPGALELLAGRLAKEVGIDARTVITGRPRPLPTAHEIALMRVAQEALANVRRHARATRATMTLSYLSEVTVLDVQDDGVGFSDRPPPGDAGGGFGIRNMRRRLEELRGKLTVESLPGEGTTIVAELPFLEERRAEKPASVDAR
jgi:signal transduction histidine kinase